jgi:hypothetical protein
MGDPVTNVVWEALVLVILTAVAVEAILIIAIMRQVGRLLLQLKPGRIGEVDGGPEVGAHVELHGVDWVQPTVALFVAPGCRLCGPLAKAVPVVRSHFPEVRVMGVVVGGEGDTDRVRYADTLGDWARSDLHELVEDWAIPGTPFAVAIDAEGYVRRSGVVNSLDQLEDLVEGLALSESLGVAEDAEVLLATTGGQE